MSISKANPPLLHYDLHDGDGPYILMVHGILSSRAQFLPNLDALRTVGRPVVAELWGHGRSPSPDDPALYEPAGYVDQFERIRESLGAERWLVIGQSLGAALTLRYALDHPERVIAQAFTNSMSAMADEAWGVAARGAMEAQAARLRADGRRVLDEHPLNPTRGSRLSPELRAAFEADVGLLDPEGVALTGLHTVPSSPVRSRVARLTVPTLLVAGDREKRFQPQRELAEHTIPALEVVRLDGGHAVNIDAADDFNAAVVEFFRRALAAEARTSMQPKGTHT